MGVLGGAPGGLEDGEITVKNFLAEDELSRVFTVQARSTGHIEQPEGRKEHSRSAASELERGRSQLYSYADISGFTRNLLGEDNTTIKLSGRASVEESLEYALRRGLEEERKSEQHDPGVEEARFTFHRKKASEEVTSEGSSEDFT